MFFIFQLFFPKNVWLGDVGWKIYVVNKGLSHSVIILNFILSHIIEGYIFRNIHPPKPMYDVYYIL